MNYCLLFRLLLLHVFLSSVSMYAVDEKKNKNNVGLNFSNKTKFGILGLLCIIFYVLKKSNKEEVSNKKHRALNKLFKSEPINKLPQSNLEHENERKIQDKDIPKRILLDVDNNILPQPEINLSIVRYFDLLEHIHQQYENRKILQKKHRILNKNTIDNPKQPQILCDQETTKTKKNEQIKKIIKNYDLPPLFVIAYVVKKSFKLEFINKLPNDNTVESERKEKIQDKDTPKTILSNVDNNILPQPEINLPIVRYFDLLEHIHQQYENRKILQKKHRTLNKDAIDNLKKPLCNQEITKMKKNEQIKKIIKNDAFPKAPVISYIAKKPFKSEPINKLPRGNAIEPASKEKIIDQYTTKEIKPDVFMENIIDTLSAQDALSRSYVDQIKFNYPLSAQEAKKEATNRVTKNFLEFFTNKKSLLAEEQLKTELKTELIEYNMIPEYIYGGVWKNDRIILCDYSESILYRILKNNVTSFIKIILQAKNIYEIISLYDDQIYDFYSIIQDIRILSLLYYKRNFDDFHQNKSPIEEKIIGVGKFFLHYPRMTYFNDYLRDFIVNISNENLEKIFNQENNIFQILKTCIPGKNKKLWLTGDCLWRQLYFANEKRIEKNRSVQENPLTAYCVHYISYIYNTSIHALVQQKTPLASYLLGLMGKTESLPYVNKKDVMYLYTLKSWMERLPNLVQQHPHLMTQRIGDLNYLLENTGWSIDDLNYLLENTGWSNVETTSPENNYE